MTLSKIPAILYHGSAYRTSLLKPGLKASMAPKHYDQTESNAYLYATPERDEALFHAFCGIIEHHYNAKRVRKDQDQIQIDLEDSLVPTLAALSPLQLYLYRFCPEPDDQWVLVDSAQNPGYPEYKSQAEIGQERFQRTSLPVGTWLDSHKVNFVTPSGQSYTL